MNRAMTTRRLLGPVALGVLAMGLVGCGVTAVEVAAPGPTPSPESGSGEQSASTASPQTVLLPLQCQIIRATTLLVAGQATDPIHPKAVLGVELRRADSPMPSAPLIATASLSGPNLPGLTATGNAFQFSLPSGFALPGDRVIVTATAADGRRTSTSPTAVTTPPSIPPTSDSTSTDVTQHGLFVMEAPAGTIFTIRGDGTGKTVLSEPGHTPSWTPDGKIIFASQQNPGQVKIMDADGGNVRQIGNLNLHVIIKPQLARNGLIAFADDQSDPGQTGQSSIWIMHEDGSGLRQLVEHGQVPSLALSGTWLTYTLETNQPYHREICRINTDGTGSQQLTFLGDPDYPDANASVISPDETTIAFFSGKEADQGAAGFTQSPLTFGYRNVAVIPAAGGARKTLTSTRPVTTQAEMDALAPTDGICADNPAWSPDGQWIIYDRGGPHPDGCGTWMIDLDGQNDRRLFAYTRGVGDVLIKYVNP